MASRKDHMKRVSPSMIIAVVALIVSMSGGAYAATRVLITNVHQIGPGVRHQLRGNTGPMGPQGPAGQAGQQQTITAQAAGVSVTRQQAPNSVLLCAAGGGSCTTGTDAVTCPAGTNVTGGGYVALDNTDGTTSSNDVATLQDGPLTNGWNVTINNLGSTRYGFFVYALCLRS